MASQKYEQMVTKVKRNKAELRKNNFKLLKTFAKIRTAAEHRASLKAVENLDFFR